MERVVGGDFMRELSEMGAHLNQLNALVDEYVTDNALQAEFRKSLGSAMGNAAVLMLHISAMQPDLDPDNGHGPEAPKDSLMDVFVERKFELGTSAQVVARFGSPAVDGDAFMCEYQIVWPARVHSSRAWGLDQVQALLLAMEKAHADLLSTDAARSGQLRWAESSDFGLPLSRSVDPKDFE